MITREDLVTQSVTDYVRAGIIARGYPQNEWVLVESFDFVANPPQLGEGKQVIAVGFNFDAPPTEAECGSDLSIRPYTLEFFVFGTSATYARNLAGVIKFTIEQDYLIPLRDIGDPAKPIIDYLEVVHAISRREPIPDPEPWQAFVWTTTALVEDTYHASLA